MILVILIKVVWVLLLVTSPGRTDNYDPGFGEYVEREVALDHVDEKEAFTAKYDNKPEKSVTAFYLKPRGWNVAYRGEVPYAAMIYTSSLSDKKSGPKQSCGAVLMTKKLIMTICACVATFLRFLKMGVHVPAPYRLAEDILGTPIHVLTNSVFAIYDQDHPYKLSVDRTKQVRSNDQCEEVFKITEGNRKHEEDQRTNVALLVFEPDLKEWTPEILPPWPPVTFSYDIVVSNQSSDGRNPLYGLHPSRPTQSVNIASFGFQQKGWVNIYDSEGKAIRVNDSLATFRTTLCNQDTCLQTLFKFENMLTYTFGSETNNQKTANCFCDANLNGEMDVCRGLPGSPIVYNGALVGVLSMPVPCSSRAPRAVIGKSLHSGNIDYIGDLCKEYYETATPGNKSGFNRSAGDVQEYEIFLPPKDFEPEIENPSVHQIVFSVSGIYFSVYPSTSLQVLALIYFNLITN